MRRGRGEEEGGGAEEEEGSGRKETRGAVPSKRGPHATGWLGKKTRLVEERGGVDETSTGRGGRLLEAPRAEAPPRRPGGRRGSQEGARKRP